MIRSIAILAVVSGALVSGVSTCFPPTPTPTSATKRHGAVYADGYRDGDSHTDGALDSHGR
jgi:hypothetical protein